MGKLLKVEWWLSMAIVQHHSGDKKVKNNYSLRDDRKSYILNIVTGYSIRNKCLVH